MVTNNLQRSWGGAITSLPIPLKAGRYTMDITSKGYPSQNIFPHLKIYVNDKLIGDFFVIGGSSRKGS